MNLLKLLQQGLIQTLVQSKEAVGGILIMFKLKLFKRKIPDCKTTKFYNTNTFSPSEVIKNQVEFIIGDIIIKIERNTTIPPKNELTAVIPKAEIRRRFYEKGCTFAEEEIILNSITLVDAPRPPQEKKGDAVHPS